MQWLSGIPGSVWVHSLSGVQVFWLGVAIVWLLAPRAWIGRGLAGLLLLPVCWPARPLQQADVRLTVPVKPAQVLAVLHQGHDLMPFLVAPPLQLPPRLARVCQGDWQCRAALDGAEMGGYRLTRTQDGFQAVKGRDSWLVIPKATPARIDHFIGSSTLRPRWIVIAPRRQHCDAIAQRLHQAYPSSIIIAKGCQGGQWRNQLSKNSKTEQMLPGFYSTGRNGSITIPLS